MSTNGVALVDDISRLIREAEAAGLEPPGRVTLMRLTKASEHNVRKAMETLKHQAGDDGEPGGGHADSAGGGKLVAWSGFLFGAAVSIAANVLAARIAPHGAPGDWKPSVVAQVGAAVWPVGLLLSVEALSRVRWPKGTLWNLARYGGAGVVALGSAVISYTHIHEVLLTWGYNGISAGVGPLVIDGLMTVCGFAMMAKAGDQVEETSLPAAEGD